MHCDEIAVVPLSPIAGTVAPRDAGSGHSGGDGGSSGDGGEFVDDGDACGLSLRLAGYLAHRCRYCRRVESYEACPLAEHPLLREAAATFEEARRDAPAIAVCDV
jgi:hypothetical protein